MNRLNWAQPPADPTGLSFSDLKKMYGIVYRNLQECKRIRGAEKSTLRASRKAELELREEKKVLTSKVALISKKSGSGQILPRDKWMVGRCNKVRHPWALWIPRPKVVLGA